MIEIRPNCVQNIRQLSNKRFPVLNRKAGDVVDFCGPIIVPVKSASEYKELIKFFLATFNQSAGKAGVNGQTNRYDRLSEKFVQKIWTFFQMRRFRVENFITKNVQAEVVKEKDKVLGGYSLLLDKSNNRAHINFLGVDSDIKNSKMTVQTLFNLAQRISEKAKSRNIDNISWATDSRNEKAYRLFDKFPAQKSNVGSEVHFVIPVSKFDETLNKYMRVSGN